MVKMNNIINTFNINVINKKKIIVYKPLNKTKLFIKFALKNNLIKTINTYNNTSQLSFYKNKPKFKKINFNYNEYKYTIK